MTDLSLPEAIVIVGVLYVLRGRPLLNINRGWQWYDTRNSTIRDNTKE